MSDYKIVGQIYETQNSQVYRAQLEGENRQIILKKLKPDYPTPSEMARYRLEYEIIRSLNALKVKGAIAAYDLQRYENTLAMIVEDFGGESLQKLMSQRKFSLTEALKVALKVAESLGEIHKAQIVHKDINPSNIVYRPATGELKIIDFSMATALSQESGTIDNPNYIEGTLEYISPEQTGRMNWQIDYRSDLYSLGVTLYELLTQKLPFESTDAMELVHCHMASEPVPPHTYSEIPSTVSRIVMKLMAKTPSERYQSARGLKADLETCLHQLQTLGEISDFPLGSRDISEKFAIPQKLYGREVEVEQLLASFARVRAGTTGMMLVTGYSGIGKSVLINEIHKPIVAARGYFIRGKFDQYKREIPYSALLEALGELMRQLLSESEEQLAAWKEKLLSAVGGNSQVLIDVIPEVELLIGLQPPVPILGPTESQNRFNLVFEQFIGVFASSAHPLVLFLDDMQWADAASLKLLEHLMGDRDKPYLLTIGAYRDNEVSATHPLTVTIEQMEKGGRVEKIVLKPLQVDKVNQLIADTLTCDLASSKALAELVFSKTNGNPFFAKQLLQFLYVENMLSFDSSQGRWQWDIQQMQAVGITDNVIELTIAKISTLEPQTQEVLKLAACIGNRFDLEILSQVNGKSPDETAEALWPLLEYGLILPMVDDVNNAEVSPSAIIYKFLHDRVRQAAYDLIPEERKKAVYLRVGQLLLQNTPPEKLEENIFSIVSHVNIGAQLINSPAERNELARLNLVAGQKAKAATAYQSAVKYLSAGMELLSESSWQEQYELTLDFHVELLEAKYLTAEFESAERLAAVILQEAKNLLDTVRVYEIKIQSYRAQCQFQRAIDAALEILAELEVVLPPQPSPENIEEEEKTLELLLQDKQIEDLADLPEMTAPDKLAAMRILLALTGPAYLLNWPLLIMVMHNLAKICIEYGNSSLAAGGYIYYGMYLCGIAGELDGGYRFGQLALRLLEQFDVRQQKGLILHVFNNGIKHWQDDLKETIPNFRQAVDAGIENGDLEYSGYAAIIACLNMLLIGKNLDIVASESAKYHALTIKKKLIYATEAVACYWQAGLTLQGKSHEKTELVGDVFDERVTLKVYEDTHNYTLLCCSYLVKAMIYYVFKEYANSLRASRGCKECVNYAVGMSVIGQQVFYDSLTLLALYPQVDTAQQKEYLQQVAANQERLKKWAEHAPVNYQNKYDLVVAEKARVLGENPRAWEYYDRAIAGAKKSEFLHEEAMAYERAAEFYFSIGREEVGQLYMRNALHCYLRWGAVAKVDDLEVEYPEILPRRSRRLTGTILDIETVLKASQAISREILLETLLTSLMKTVIENAGAQKGFLLLPDRASNGESKWVIEASGTVEGAEVAATAGSIVLEEAAGSVLSGGIINYVARSKENVVLRDARNSEQFTSDPYIAARQPKSLLCTPLVNQGQLTGILYLENNLTVGAFTPDRLELLQLLSSQAAISIENAKLYNQLEEKVAERTAQLAAANRAKGAFIAKMSHELGNPLNIMLGYTQLMLGNDMSKEDQANKLGIIYQSGKHLESLIENVLNFSKIESGKTTLEESNFDLSRLLDYIKSTFEGQATDKGLQLSCDKASDVPRYIRTDLVKLRQVLINLVNNALKFTDVGGVSVRASLADDVLQNQGTRKIHFEISDTGAGIPPEELDSIFEPFVQTSTGKQKQEGAGLGLPISRELVRLMGGDIFVSSQVGQGTVFHFDIAVRVVETTEIDEDRER